MATNLLALICVPAGIIEASMIAMVHAEFVAVHERHMTGALHFDFLDVQQTKKLNIGDNTMNPESEADGGEGAANRKTSVRGCRLRFESSGGGEWFAATNLAITG